MNTSTPMAVLEAYRAAVYDRNADAFLALYHPDARVYDTWGVWVYEGTAARQSAIADWFSGLGDERVEVSFDSVQVTEESHLAVLTATGRYTAMASDGQALRSMENRFTWALQRDGGGWFILHEHTSTPIGFNDLKGILQRSEA